MKAFRISIPPTAFALSSGKKKRPRKEDADHLKWIRSLPCIITGKRGNIHAAHVRYGEIRYAKRETGIGEKPDDKWTVPLSAELHTGGADSQHAAAERTWWLLRGVDPLLAALALHGVSGDDEAAEVILREARSAAKSPNGTPVYAGRER